MSLEQNAMATSAAAELLRTMHKAPVLKALLIQEVSREFGLDENKLAALSGCVLTAAKSSAEAFRSKRQRLPVYGREIVELRKRGMVPARAVHVIVASSPPFDGEWEWGKSFPRVVVPSDLEPPMIDFAFLAGLDVLVFWSSYMTMIERIVAIIRAIMRYTPTYLHVFDMGTNYDFTVVSYKNGIELPEYAA